MHPSRVIPCFPATIEGNPDLLIENNALLQSSSATRRDHRAIPDDNGGTLNSDGIVVGNEKTLAADASPLGDDQRCSPRTRPASTATARA